MNLSDTAFLMIFKTSILIPAYQPDEAMVQLVSQLREQSPSISIIVVNDGSDPERQVFFDALSDLNIHLIQHEHNQGKGAALKTGFEYFMTHLAQNQVGVVTADADGQHRPEDILKVVLALERNPDALHLGCRKLSKEQTPLRSWIGNQLTAKVIRALTRQPISDTQTGLRGIPSALLPALIQIESNGYALETEMLLIAKEAQIRIMEQPIQTIYIDANRGSHFNPLLDSIKIYWVFIRYAVISILSAILDFCVFAVANFFSGNLLCSLVVGRICSASFNYLYNRQTVFKSRSSYLKSAVLYTALVGLNLFLAYHIIHSFVWMGLHLYTAKIAADITLFIVNFYVQRFMIFKTSF